MLKLQYLEVKILSPPMCVTPILFKEGAREEVAAKLLICLLT